MVATDPPRFVEKNIFLITTEPVSIKLEWQQRIGTSFNAKLRFFVLSSASVLIGTIACFVTIFLDTEGLTSCRYRVFKNKDQEF